MLFIIIFNSKVGGIMKQILNGIFKENAVFSLALGLCSTLAITTTVEKSYMMGLSVLFVLIFSNLVISLIRKIVPESVKMPVFIVIIGTFVTIISLLLEKFVPSLYSSFGIYLSLITVNCIVLGRALSFASKQTVGKSLLDAIGIGLGYTFALILIGFVRELLGTNTITLMNDISQLTGYRLIFKNVLPGSMFPISVFTSPAGAFITIGILMAIFNVIRRKHESN